MPAKPEFGLGVYGATGRMGQEILNIAEHEKGWDGVVAIARNGFDEVIPKDVDVIVDFSSPAGLMDAIDWCVKNKTPLVSGTTGMSPAERKKMEAAAKEIPVLWAPNMSLGVHVMARALKTLAALQDWDVQVEETHHRYKKDKPSGTALFFQNELKQILPKKDLPEPLSQRLGGVVGIHRVSAGSDEELLIFEHQALSRTVFARGALTAAAWLAKRKGKAKLYQMSDVIADLEES